MKPMVIDGVNVYALPRDRPPKTCDCCDKPLGFSWFTVDFERVLPEGQRAPVRRVCSKCWAERFEQKCGPEYRPPRGYETRGEVRARQEPPEPRKGRGELW